MAGVHEGKQGGTSSLLRVREGLIMGSKLKGITSVIEAVGPIQALTGGSL